MSEGKVQDAERAVHTLKGLAGTIGAQTLHDAAHMLEKSIHGPNAMEYMPEVVYALTELIQALQPVLQSIQTAQSLSPKSSDTQHDQKAIDQLLLLLRNDDANAQRHFVQHQALFTGLLQDGSQSVKAHITTLALDEALALVFDG